MTQKRAAKICTKLTTKLIIAKTFLFRGLMCFVYQNVLSIDLKNEFQNATIILLLLQLQYGCNNFN